MTTNDTIEALEAQNEAFRQYFLYLQSWVKGDYLIYQEIARFTQRPTAEMLTDRAKAARGEKIYEICDKALQSPRHDLSKIKAVLDDVKDYADNYPNRCFCVLCRPSIQQLYPEQRESILKEGSDVTELDKHLKHLNRCGTIQA